MLFECLLNIMNVASSFLFLGLSCRRGRKWRGRPFLDGTGETSPRVGPHTPAQPRQGALCGSRPVIRTNKEPSEQSTRGRGIPNPIPKGTPEEMWGANQEKARLRKMRLGVLRPLGASCTQEGADLVCVALGVKPAQWVEMLGDKLSSLYG